MLFWYFGILSINNNVAHLYLSNVPYITVYILSANISVNLCHRILSMKIIKVICIMFGTSFSPRISFTFVSARTPVDVQLIVFNDNVDLM